MPPSFFSTAPLSPVRAASSNFKPVMSNIFASAGMRSPVSRSRISPGTMFFVKISFRRPFRSTLVVGSTIRFSASIAFSALYSCTKPKTITNAMMDEMTQKLMVSPITSEIIAAANKTQTMKFANWLSNTLRGVTFCFSSSSLMPYFSSLIFASSDDKPSLDVSKAANMSLMSDLS